MQVISLWVKVKLGNPGIAENLRRFVGYFLVIPSEMPKLFFKKKKLSFVQR